jgi:small-conductance mechanosensitive channel
MILQYPKPSVLFMGLGESSIDFELRCFIKDVNSMLSVRSDMYFAIYNALNEACIDIPFPQRVITMKQDN